MAKAKKNMPWKHLPKEAVAAEEKKYLNGEIEEDQVLEKKTKDPELLARLEQLEREIMQRARSKGFIN